MLRDGITGFGRPRPWPDGSGSGTLGRVRESASDLTQLQDLLDRSLGSAGSHLRSIFTDDRRLTASELIASLNGIFEMHLAAVTSTGAPLVAPADGIFFRGNVWFGLPARSVRAHLLRYNPRVSASFIRDSFAFIVHGEAKDADEASNTWNEYEALMRDLYVAQYGPGWLDWYEQLRQDGRATSFTGYIEPRLMFAKR